MLDSCFVIDEVFGENRFISFQPVFVQFDPVMKVYRTISILTVILLLIIWEKYNHTFEFKEQALTM